MKHRNTPEGPEMLDTLQFMLNNNRDRQSCRELIDAHAYDEWVDEVEEPIEEPIPGLTVIEIHEFAERYVDLPRVTCAADIADAHLFILELAGYQVFIDGPGCSDFWCDDWKRGWTWWLPECGHYEVFKTKELAALDAWRHYTCNSQQLDA